MATIKDIARESGLGIATISKYLNGKTVRKYNKEAIDAAIEKLGFTQMNELARNLKANRSRTIGAVIPDFGNGFSMSVVTAFEEAMRKSGYGVIVCDCRSNEEREREAVNFLLGKRVDGMLNLPINTDGTHLLNAIRENIPVVLFDNVPNAVKDKVDAVLVDNVGGSVHATKSLVDKGHKKIAVILGAQRNFTAQQRLLGYNQVLIQNSLMPDNSYVFYSDYTIQGGYECMRKVVENTDATAVFITNYEMTLGAVIALNDLNIHIPDQISVVGFDYQNLSQIIRPKLTVISQPLEKIGHEAAVMLLEKLENGKGGATKKIISLPTEITPGDSIASPGSKG